MVNVPMSRDRKRILKKEHKNIQFHFCQNFDLEFRVSQSLVFLFFLFIQIWVNNKMFFVHKYSIAIYINKKRLI